MRRYVGSIPFVEFGLMHNRDIQLQQWLSFVLGTNDFNLVALPGDASFRTYQRVKVRNQDYIVMIAPPEKESTKEFVSIAKTWLAQGVQVPLILAFDQHAGFVLMSDFGDRLMLDLLNENTVEFYYTCAIDLISHLQSMKAIKLPLYDAAFVGFELELFKEWFIGKLMNIPLSHQEIVHLTQVDRHIIEIFDEQPQHTVHRDYHSRNLMVLPDATLGVIDFQDAMIGPITYDLVSLLKDCYITWPKEQVYGFVQTFFSKLLAENKVKSSEFGQFLRWFDWVGLQRHLKVLGIFSRLKLRDNKPQYLKNIPRIMAYILDVTGQYPALSDFNHFLHLKILPNLTGILQQHCIDFIPDMRVA